MVNITKVQEVVKCTHSEYESLIKTLYDCWVLDLTPLTIAEC